VNTSPQEMIGRKCYEFWADPEIPCNDCPTVRAFKTQKTEEGIMQTPDGRIWAEKGEPVFDDQNQLMGVLEIAYDITEKAKSLADLKESEEKYRRVIENSNDAIFIAQDGGIKFPNPMTEKITGCSAKELAGIPFINFIHPDDREMVLERHARRLKGEKPPSTYSFRIINNSGEKLWVQLNVVTTMWEGRPATLNFLRDISVEKRLHARLLHAQKMEAIATLTGGIAHDFNNLLSIILGNISLAEDEIKTGSEAIRFLKEAETASLRAAELTNRLTSFSTGETPVKKTGSINDVVKETAAAIFKDADASYELTLPDDPWPVEFDKRQIKQALEHVFLNAVEFSPNQAAVKITIDNLMIFEANGYNLTLPEGRYIKITIEDQGIGIPEENLLKIFDPYFSTKEMGAQKGMGLGLTLSRSVIEKHDGMITVESKPGMGSVFRIYLPAYESETSLHIPIQPPRPKPSPDSVKRILIMDDEKMIRKLCGNFLRRTNYEAEFAKNGEEAVELYKQAMILHKPFDAVILDLTVKRGMSGKTALKKILELDPYAKAIISSGYSTESVMEHFNQYGFMGVLIKPFSKNEFIKELHRVMSV
jgi:PAS domain S-box-containing protein